ncbi:hypothetical protein R6Q57_002071 [Mikania cordata]
MNWPIRTKHSKRGAGATEEASAGAARMEGGVPARPRGGEGAVTPSGALHGVEYAFGYHEQSTTGVYEGKPAEWEQFTFRKQILIGWTEMSLPEIRGLMEELAGDYKGNSYELITRNCNHFCNDACIRLTGNPIPTWINRLARIGKSPGYLKF